jgi:hypothetical protein
MLGISIEAHDGCLDLFAQFDQQSIHPTHIGSTVLYARRVLLHVGFDNGTQVLEWIDLSQSLPEHTMECLYILVRYICVTVIGSNHKQKVTTWHSCWLGLDDRFIPQFDFLKGRVGSRIDNCGVFLSLFAKLSIYHIVKVIQPPSRVFTRSHVAGKLCCGGTTVLTR